MIQRAAQTVLETKFGKFEFLVYREKKSGKEHIVVVKPWKKKLPWVRLHSECSTGDLFASKFCDCRQQLYKSLKLIQRHGGALLYLRQEGRGLGLTDKIRAYEFQRQGMDTVEANLKVGRKADEREYAIAVEILQDLGIQSLVLLSNNPDKVMSLRENGFVVRPRSLLISLRSSRGKKYLQAKKEKLGHRMA